MSLDVTLDPCSELRFEVPANARPAKIQLVPEDSKFAEINGSEMAPGRFYEFPRGSTGSVYTWHGCALKIQNLPEDQMYTAEAPAMQHYAHAHSVLEQQRRAAKERIFERKDASAEGPRALVCGGPSSGKSTVCNVLVNYASRLDWQLTFVDLDISCNSITIPGAVAAAPVDIPVPVEEGYSLFPPLSYFYASSNLDKKGHELYHLHVTSLAEKVNERHALNDNARCGGMIVKAMSSKYTSKDVLHAVRQFRIDTIFVMGDDKLYAQLRSGIAREGLPAKLLQLPRSGGVVTKSDTQRDVARKERIQSYFYGWPHLQLSPHTYIITDFEKIKIVKIGAMPNVHMEGLLPIGEDSALTPLDPTVVPVSKEMEQSLVGFSQAENIEDCARLPVSGFGLVLAVNLDAKQLHLRVPMLVKELNCTALLLGDIRSYAGHDRA